TFTRWKRPLATAQTSGADPWEPHGRPRPHSDHRGHGHVPVRRQRPRAAALQRDRGRARPAHRGADLPVHLNYQHAHRPVRPGSSAPTSILIRSGEGPATYAERASYAEHAVVAWPETSHSAPDKCP